MPEWISEVSKIVIPGLFVAIITSIVTVRLSIQRFYEEKWWEKKHEIYTRLFESLHHLKKYALEHLETYENGQDIPENKRKELNNDWKKFTREFDKLHDLASFQLSEEAVKILDDYKKQKKAAENHENVLDWIDDDAAAAIKCLELLSIEAKNDLQIKKT